MRKNTYDETIIQQEFTTEDGDRYKVTRRFGYKPPEFPIFLSTIDSGLRDTIIAFLAFSMAGLLIYGSWTIAYRVLNSTQTTIEVIERR